MCVVGSGTRFLSGISVYTVRLANALAEDHSVSLLTMRRLLPRRLYPGSARVGADLTQVRPDARLAVLDGVDWYWMPSIARAVAFLTRQRPEFLILQWWTGTVLHTYLLLAVLARLMRIRVIVEFHEVVDTGEIKVPGARRYVSLLAPQLMRLAHAFVVHSEFDRAQVVGVYPIGGRPVEVVRHGLYDHLRATDPTLDVVREAPADVLNLLYFGVIRPYKGLEHLVTAFDRLGPEEVGRYWLTVVGETWEGWTLPGELIRDSRHRARITYVDRYVPDAELQAHVQNADAVVLPYLRSSASGPLHVAMAAGLPLVVTAVGGLPEAVEGYGGAIVIPAGDPEPVLDAIRRLPAMRGTRWQQATSWGQAVATYGRLFQALRPRPIDDES